jgi:hypothetical protein
MNRTIRVCALLWTACSKPDDCTKLYEKVAPVMKAIATDNGKAASDVDKQRDAFIADCRKAPKGDPEFACLFDAKDQDAVKACMAKALENILHKSMATEAREYLNALGKKLKIAAAETNAFPIGTARQLPASPNSGPGCCGSSNGKCAVTTEWTADPIWNAVAFSISAPTRYRYTYTSSDGKSFTATATGDLDCDGKPGVFTLTGTFDATGNVTVKLDQPPAGLY